MSHLIKTLYLGDLPRFSSEDALLEIFHPFGNVREIKIIRKNSISLGYGFISFYTHENAAHAMSCMNNKIFCGRCLRVKWAAFNISDSTPLLQMKKTVDTNNHDLAADVIISSIHVTFRALQVTELHILYSFLNRLFLIINLNNFIIILCKYLNSANPLPFHGANTP